MAKVVLGTGSALASTVVTNDDIEATSDDYDRIRSGSSLHEWVMKRAGVDRRCFVAAGEGTSDLALEACRNALDDARVKADEVDLLVLSTFSYDYRLPGTISGPAAGLALIDAILARGDLTGYHLAHSARADLCRRLGHVEDARASYERALELTQQGPERRFLEGRLRELNAS